MEYCDIYDRNKQKTGRKTKRIDYFLQDGEYLLSVLGVVSRPDGKFLITQRAFDKGWAPGWWEVPGGAVQAGESSKEAVLREVKEETGLDVSGAKGGFVFSYHRENPEKGDNYFVDIYRFELEFEEKDVIIQKREALDFRIASLDEIKRFAKEGIFLHYDSIKQVFEEKNG